MKEFSEAWSFGLAVVLPLAVYGLIAVVMYFRLSTFRKLDNGEVPERGDHTEELGILANNPDAFSPFIKSLIVQMIFSFVMFFTTIILLLRFKLDQSRLLGGALWAASIASATFLQCSSYIERLMCMLAKAKTYRPTDQWPASASTAELRERGNAIFTLQSVPDKTKVNYIEIIPVVLFLCISVATLAVRLRLVSKWASCWLSWTSVSTVLTIIQTLVQERRTPHMRDWSWYRELVFLIFSFSILLCSTWIFTIAHARLIVTIVYNSGIVLHRAWLMWDFDHRTRKPGRLNFHRM